MNRLPPTPHYQTDLCLEGLLDLHVAGGVDGVVDAVGRVLRYRGTAPRDSLSWRMLFTDLHYAMWQVTGDPAMLEGWAEDVEAMDRALPRDAEGCITYFVEPEPPRLLIDMVQNVAVRYIRLGRLTGDPGWVARGVEQLERYAVRLVHPRLGLWHHGRGWREGQPEALAPVGWCRGQGWVLRGLVLGLLAMPGVEQGRASLASLLSRLTAALLPWQDGEGMWHQVVQEPATTPAETSGTGMILAYLQQAVNGGLLPGSASLDAALRRGRAALAGRVDAAGDVHGGCADGRVQDDVAGYGRVCPSVNDRHAVAGVLSGLAAPWVPVRPVATPACLSGVTV
jgi:rhamnogalacturonyl hydrolase YesR